MSAEFHSESYTELSNVVESHAEEHVSVKKVVRSSNVSDKPTLSKPSPHESQEDVLDSEGLEVGYRSDDGEESYESADESECVQRLGKVDIQGYVEDSEDKEPGSEAPSDFSERKAPSEKALVVTNAGVDNDSENDREADVGSAAKPDTDGDVGGYEEDEEDDGDADESELPHESASNRRSDSEGYDEEDMESSDVEVVEENARKGSKGNKDWADDSDEQLKSEEEHDEGRQEDNESKNAVFVPRRTGFWDHDNRFEDITVQESRAPRASAKLWDKSDVDRWQHDKYVESEQGPKQEWEIEQDKRDSDDRGRYAQRRRPESKFADFVEDATSHRRGASRGGRGGRGGHRLERGGRYGEDLHETGMTVSEFENASVSPKRNLKTSRDTQGGEMRSGEASETSDTAKNKSEYADRQKAVASGNRGSAEEPTASNRYERRSAGNKQLYEPEATEENERKRWEAAEPRYEVARRAPSSRPRDNVFEKKGQERPAQEDFPPLRSKAQAQSGARVSSKGIVANADQGYPFRDQAQGMTKGNASSGSSKSNGGSREREVEDERLERSLDRRADRAKPEGGHEREREVREGRTGERREVRNSRKAVDGRDVERDVDNRRGRHAAAAASDRANESEYKHEGYSQRRGARGDAEPVEEARSRRRDTHDSKGRQGAPTEGSRNDQELRRRDDTVKPAVRGRGRGVMSERLKESSVTADDFKKERMTRDKRIEQLPPRLRDKAREKVEKEKRVAAASDEDVEQYQDAEIAVDDANEEADVQNGGDQSSAKEKLPRPKRYSSQRQKAGASVVDLPSSIPEDGVIMPMVDQSGFMQQAAFYNAQLAQFMTQQQQLHQQLHLQQNQPANQAEGMVPASTVKMLHNQIAVLQTQLSQQQQQRDRLPHSVGYPQQHPHQGVPQLQPPISMGIAAPGAYRGQDGGAGVNIESMYAVMNQASGMNASDLQGPQYQMSMNQMIQQPQVPYTPHSVGLYVPSMHQQMSIHHQQQQQQQVEIEQQQQLRRSRPAAVPIRPPPGLAYPQEGMQMGPG